jgi:hypothetical protein
MAAMTGGALWRIQPMTHRWAQWNQENSNELLERLEAADMNWNRGKPSFTVTTDGKVTMSWAETQQVPLLVVDQFRGDGDDIEPPPHPDCTYTMRIRRWLRNLTVLCKAMPGTDIDAGFLHDYRKGLRLCTTQASEVMHTAPPSNYHVKVARWELDQEPQPQPCTQEHVLFEAHRAKRIRAAQRKQQSMEAHRRQALVIFRKRASETAAQETSHLLEQASRNAGSKEIRRLRAMQAGAGAGAAVQLMDKPTCYQCNRVSTFREETAQLKNPRFSVGEREMEEAERTVAQADGSDSETEPNEAPLFRAAGSSEGEETLTSSTRMEATGEAASSAREIKKAEAVHPEQWEATKEAKGASAPTGTIGSGTEPNEVALLRAERLAEGEEPRASGTRAEGRGTATGKPSVVGGGNKFTQDPRSWTAERKKKEEPPRAGGETRAAKRSKLDTTANWTVFFFFMKDWI